MHQFESYEQRVGKMVLVKLDAQADSILKMIPRLRCPTVYDLPFSTWKNNRMTVCCAIFDKIVACIHITLFVSCTHKKIFMHAGTHLTIKDKHQIWFLNCLTYMGLLNFLQIIDCKTQK